MSALREKTIGNVGMHGMTEFAETEIARDGGQTAGDCAYMIEYILLAEKG